MANVVPCFAACAQTFDRRRRSRCLLRHDDVTAAHGGQALRKGRGAERSWSGVFENVAGHAITHTRNRTAQRSSKKKATLGKAVVRQASAGSCRW